jgi:hypothetical protein
MIGDKTMFNIVLIDQYENDKSLRIFDRVNKALNAILNGNLLDKDSLETTVPVLCDIGRNGSSSNRKGSNRPANVSKPDSDREAGSAPHNRGPPNVAFTPRHLSLIASNCSDTLIQS